MSARRRWMGGVSKRRGSLVQGTAANAHKLGTMESLSSRSPPSPGCIVCQVYCAEWPPRNCVSPGAVQPRHLGTMPGVVLRRPRIRRIRGIRGGLYIFICLVGGSRHLGVVSLSRRQQRPIRLVCSGRLLDGVLLLSIVAAVGRVVRCLRVYHLAIIAILAGIVSLLVATLGRYAAPRFQLSAIIIVIVTWPAGMRRGPVRRRRSIVASSRSMIAAVTAVIVLSGATIFTHGVGRHWNQGGADRTKMPTAEVETPEPKKGPQRAEGVGLLCTRKRKEPPLCRLVGRFDAVPPSTHPSTMVVSSPMAHANHQRPPTPKPDKTRHRTGERTKTTKEEDDVSLEY